MNLKEKYRVIPIQYDHCKDWLLYKHYAHRIPSITYAFGLYDSNNILQGICTYGSPPSQSLCIGICGVEYRELILELNRLCLAQNIKNLASYFVSQTFLLLAKPKIIVSYSDTSMGHHGYIYQALNFIYTGLSEERTEWRMVNSNLHSKTICETYSLETRKNDDRFKLVDRPVKHRYLMFLGNKKQVNEMKSKLKYEVKPYPKGDNQNYDASYEPQTQGMLI